MTESAKTVAERLNSRGWFAPEPDLFGDMAAGFAAQDAAVHHVAPLRGGFGGYKIAFNSPTQMEKLGIPMPGAARVFADQIVQSGATLHPDDYEQFMIEPEIAVILGEDLVPGQTYEAAAMNDFVARCFAAFELLDRRNLDGHFHVPSVLAHNVFNEGAVLGGPGLDHIPNHLHLCSLITDNSKVLLDAEGVAPQAPLEAMAFLANHFTGRGQTMPKGSLLLLGTHMPLYPVQSGHEMRFELGELGSVSFSMA